MSNPFAAYPPFLKAKHIADAMQISETTAREMMRQSGLIIPIGRTGKVKIVERDKFFEYALSLMEKDTG